MKDHLLVTTFSDFQLNPALVKSLGEEGYTIPTPIQTQAIPSVLLGKDLLGIAQTGTGKTAAFALPILHRLAADKREPMRRGCRVLVLSPTRELASQIADSFRTYGRYLGIRVAVIFGGVGHAPQREALTRGVDVLVATPGRLLDHIGERNVVLDGVEIFVLDEADQMLDMGFIRPIRQIVAKLSARRQSLFFSATMPKEIGHLAGELLRDPVKVSVTPSATTVERVRQHVYLVDARAKRSLLVELLANPELSRTLVFTRTKRGADKVAQHLAAAGISVAAIHGNKSQNQREAALAAVQGVEDPDPGRHRRGRARDRHRSRHARRQLRAAERSRELRASHRPHGARRRGRHCHFALRCGGARLPARHRAPDAAIDRNDRSASRSDSRAGSRGRPREQRTPAVTRTAARIRQTQSAQR